VGVQSVGEVGGLVSVKEYERYVRPEKGEILW
jgi:hypothetical protein